MANDHVQKVRLKNHQDPYDVTKEVTVEPEETQKTTTVGAPDAATQQYIQKTVVEPAQRAYGIDPNTGKATPFEVLGYNPEVERARREEEQRINNIKRRENALFNAIAVVGDSITTLLGGNVWQRQPNNIGAKAKADNDRLIAEQKAEDEANQAKLRNAGVQYANTVNKLIQGYLSKTSTTTKTGGSRTEKTHHEEQNGYREQSHALSRGEGKSGSGSGGGSKNKKVVKVAQIDAKGNIVGYRSMNVPANEADAYSRIVQTTLQQKFENGELTNELDKLEKAGIYNPNANDPTKRWNADKILTYGRSFNEAALKSEVSRLWTLSDEYDGKEFEWTPYSGPGAAPSTPAGSSANNLPPYLLRALDNNADDNLPPYMRKKK